MDRAIIQDNFKKIRAALAPWLEKADGILARAKEKFGRKQSFIGIDVGTSSVKVVQMADVNGEMTVVKSALVDIGGPPGSREEVLASLKTALVGVETKGAKVVAVVNCPRTCTRRIVAPHMPQKELAQAIQWEAKNAIPFSIEHALMDFEVLGEASEKGVKKVTVAVAAAPRETVDQLLSLFSKADVEISAMIPMSMSLRNLIAASREKRQATVAVVEMGASVTELNIYREGRLAFSRKLPVAGTDITKSMTSTLMSGQGRVELSMEEAEKIKKEQGIPGGEGTELVDGKILSGQILSLVRPCVEQLAGEIERSFDFYREESRGGRVGKVLLFGGGANLKGLAEFLRDATGAEIGIGNSFEDIKTLPGAVSGGENAGSRFDLAVGAAMDKADRINLLPVEVKEKTRRFIGNVSLKGAAAGLLVSLMLFYAGARIQLRGLDKKMKALRLERRTLAPQTEKLREEMIVDEILDGKPHWEDAFREIGNVIPAKVYLTHLDMDNDIVRLKGYILQGDRDAQAILSNFMLTLEEGIFRQVNLVTTKKEAGNTAVSEFEITAGLD